MWNGKWGKRETETAKEEEEEEKTHSTIYSM